MRGKYRPHHILEVVLLFIALAGFSAGNSKANENSKYLDAVRTFADNVLKYGRDTYGPKHTPLFVDGLNIHTHEPVKWISPEGERWILSNLASQQNLFRTLDGLTKITGDPKYRQAAVEAIEYAFANLRSSNGLLHWGRVAAYDAKAEKVCGAATHSLKFDYPYYELMWEVNPEATQTFIESFWSAHILDWSNLAMNRTASLNKPVGQAWKHEYKGGTVFFESQGSSFVNTGSDLYYAAAILSKQSGDKLPLIWAKRLAHRYVETRDPNVGISGYVYNRNAYRKVPTFYPFGDDFKGHLVLLGTLFPKHPGVGNPDVRQWLLGELIVSPGIIGNIFVNPWICQFLLGEILGADGKEFTQGALEELTALGKIAYRKKDNSFIPMLTDGTTLEGYVCKKDSSFGPKGTVFMPIRAVSTDFWAYALAYRMTGDSFMWDMARNIAQGIGFGDIGTSPDSELKLKKDAGCSDPFVLLGFLELYKETRTKAFLRMAERIGDNILTDHFYKGFFVPSHKHTYAKFDAIYSLVLLHLNATTDIKPSLVPRVWPSRPSFNISYRGKESVIDNEIIYNLIESSEPPKSLQEAAAVGEIHEIKSLISKGVDVNGREDTMLKTALHRAVVSGHKDVTELLLAKGADVNAGDVYAATALHYAAELGHIEVARLLVAKGADVNLGNEWNMTPLYSAISVGNKDVAELLIAHGADVNVKNNNGETPLDIAVTNNRKDIIDLLVEKGAVPSSIHAAVRVGVLARVKALLEQGMDVNAQDDEGVAPLHYAVQEGHKELAEFLIAKGADVNGKDNYGYTPLVYAIWYENKDIIKLLVSKGADVNLKPEKNYPPLHHAVWNEDIDTVKLLVATGAKFDVKDRYDWTAFRYAASQGNRELIEFFVSKGADVSSFHMAACMGDLTRVKRFVEHGANVDTKDELGWTPLYWAASTGQENVAAFLIAKGANIHTKTNDGTTILYQAAQAGARELAELLISRGADVNTKGKYGNTPLHRAASAGHLEVVELLIAKGATVNAKGRNDLTPLHSATMSGHKDVVEFLIAKGAEVDVEDKWNLTALWWANRRGHKEIVELLRKQGAKE